MMVDVGQKQEKTFNQLKCIHSKEHAEQLRNEVTRRLTNTVNSTIGRTETSHLIRYGRTMRTVYNERIRRTYNYTTINTRVRPVLIKGRER